MKIENFRSEVIEERARASATVTWEECDRPSHDVYFETDLAFADSLSCNPHAFLVACTIPAMHYGEKRVSIDAAICPDLVDGLKTAMCWLRHWWYEPSRHLVQIETRGSYTFPQDQRPEREGFFFSGGIDSYATLRSNRIKFPADHPRSIKDGLLVYGLEQDIPEVFEHVKDYLSAAAPDCGLTLIPVYTDLYLHYREEDAKNQFHFWINEFSGAALAAIGHAFAKRLTGVSIAASEYVTTIGGSHPLLDLNYSSTDMQIRHDGVGLTRLEKTKLLSDWDVPLKTLRVCNQYKKYQADKFNCGGCEKCIRTMLAFLALGLLDKTDAFPVKDISEDLIRKKLRIAEDYTEEYYLELIEPLKKLGRNDLIHALQSSIADYHKKRKVTKIKNTIKQFDSQYLNSRLSRLMSQGR